MKPTSILQVLRLAPVLALTLTSCVIDATTPPAATGNGAQSAPSQSPPPDLRTKPNGNIEVVFASGCVAIFDRYGNLIQGGRGCDDVDLHRAKEAVRAHLAEQHSNFNDV
jgi:hypothetical protein